MEEESGNGSGSSSRSAKGRSGGDRRTRRSRGNRKKSATGTGTATATDAASGSEVPTTTPPPVRSTSSTSGTSRRPGASSSSAAAPGMAAVAAASSTIPHRDGRQVDGGGGGRQQHEGRVRSRQQLQRRRGGGPNKNRRQTSYASSGSSAVDPSSYLPYPVYKTLEECLERYQARDALMVRGKLRATSRDGGAFVTCDRGSLAKDAFLPTPLERNRALDGDTVFVELDPEDEEKENADDDEEDRCGTANDDEVDVGEEESDHHTHADHESCLSDAGTNESNGDGPKTWQDDDAQMKLWNPVVTGIRMRNSRRASSTAAPQPASQRTGRVVHVVPPKPLESELKLDERSGGGHDDNGPIPSRGMRIPNRRLVGSIQRLASGTLLLNPQHRSLPQFKCPPSTQQLIDALIQEEEEKEAAAAAETSEDNNPADSNRNGTESVTKGSFLDRVVFQAEYVPLSWKEMQRWPPCCRVEKLGDALTLEHEIRALLISNDVDHGDFPPHVLRHVDHAVQSGIVQGNNDELGWCPTPEMLEGRRDYRNERIFTIDPTTAKDLDDALHIKLLEPDDGNGKGIVEIGVHIADVSFFVTPGTPVDDEAQRRTTTVYLVDRTVPMLPRPLCEIACSLNENVERLAFSCVWKMHLDGTMVAGASDNVWYGRTVIKSCARLDYSTAQSIIEGKVATGEATLDDELWPPPRRPTEPHTVDEVAADVRLMHKVAMARRKIRFASGALALHGTKLTFQLDSDGQTPLLVAPYPIRDSNRLVEEYMLLANYLVAQRLITHARRLAVLRMHPEPLMDGLDSVVNVAAAAGVTIDIESGQSLHRSLVRLAQQGDPLLLQCVTNLLMTPMQAAEYFVAGTRDDPEEWRHYALNIPYYTHFTSPIRRYPDVLVHRLLQATIDGPGTESIEEFPMSEETMEALCVHSNEKRLASKTAQERCDRVYLSLFVRKHPLEFQMGVVLSVGKSSFTVFLPELGTSAMVYLMEHKDLLTYACDEQADGKRRIVLQQRPGKGTGEWKTLEIEVLVIVSVTVVFKEKPPIDIKARLEGPWIAR